MNVTDNMNGHWGSLYQQEKCIQIHLKVQKRIPFFTVSSAVQLVETPEV